jgi:Holliday junction resolvasome RuvABC endonuclease subunit
VTAPLAGQLGIYGSEVADLPIAVMGLDLSLTATGIAVGDGRTFTVKCSRTGDRRLGEIRDAVRRSLGPLVPLVVIEDLPTHAHGAGKTGMVHGAVRAMLHDLDVPYVTVVAATLKKYATGKGNADKTAMAIAALKRAGAEFADDNQCDAAWLRWMGLDALGAAAFELPALNRESLAKVSWPDLAVPA